MKIYNSYFSNPRIYGLMGFILVAVPTLLFFFVGMPGEKISSTQIDSDEIISVRETVWEGAFNPIFLIFAFGAALGAWGCYRNTLLAWTGSLFVLVLSIITLPSIGLLTLPGAVILTAGAIVKNKA